ncbi:hypothetical protein DAEQUDRAFT_770806 [Daedalea quercina L-15889]|uniref:Protein kinase domain-containing protein n=1 Tax=Daedalea quercina L-15889 TaxID=1314783 RepID=A0A165KJ75_9APHY|nr:hypothetical protein DAEQUDRAFT_770806 [Daedalea quercina L-15889]
MSLPPDEYLAALLRPIADICNQLHSPKVLKTPMKCVGVELGNSVYGATFIAEDFKNWRATSPFILSVPDNLFEPNGEPSLNAQFALSKIIERDPGIPSIIVTDFKDIAIFFPPTPHSTPQFERVSSTEPILALRVVAAAYLTDRLPPGLYLLMADPHYSVDEDLILPEGPPQDPSLPLIPDGDVFATHHRNSDFDRTTLVRDRARALQYFRWHSHVQAQNPKLVAHPNDIITAMTNDVGPYSLLADMQPVCPFDISGIPGDAATLAESVQRESPLVAVGTADAFEKSRSFTLKIMDVIAEGSEYGICTVYRCRIVSIDGQSVTSPDLCLKLFDDRFQRVRSPDEDDAELDQRLPRLFDRVVVAETYALNEAAAYKKLRPVQGSIIPWFYGTHQFTLPDGTVLYGLLMEYVDGWGLDSESVRDLSAESQIDVIRSCRNAVRILDMADISQMDWHSGQILVCTNARAQVDHAVFIDFASTTQTWEPEEVNVVRNYFGVLRVLLGREGDVGIDPDLVWKHYGEPDEWDVVNAWVPTVPNGEDGQFVRPKSMFPFILQPSKEDE